MSHLPSIFPPYELRRSHDEQGRHLLWDPIRKKWVVEQPEERVRQLLVQHLMQAHGVARSLIGVEKEIRYLEQRKRCDVVVFDRKAQPLVLCECKAPQVPLSEATLRQIARYNANLHAPHWLVTNGIRLLCFSVDAAGRYRFQPHGWPEALSEE
jgi:hypothetical protein